MNHQGSVGAAAFSPDGTRVLTGSDDNTARMWNAHTGSPVGAEVKDLHQIRGTAVAFSRDGNRVVTGGVKLGGGRGGGTACQWDVHTGSPIGQEMQHEYEVQSVAFSPDGTRVVTGSGYWEVAGIARLWDAYTGAPVGAAMPHGGAVWNAVFSPDGSTSRHRQQRRNSPALGCAYRPPIGEVMKHESGVLTVAVSADGMRLVTGSTDGTARLWDAHGGAPIAKVVKHEFAVLAPRSVRTERESSREARTELPAFGMGIRASVLAKL